MSNSKDDSKDRVIKLENCVPFGIGGRRLCFTHPDDQGKCIKVLRTDEKRTLRCSASSSMFSSFRPVYNNNLDEQVELDILHKQLGPKMKQHFPQSYGMVPTDIGQGLVVDLVRDHDGQISLSLRELISRGLHPQEFQEAFVEFGEFLLNNLILTRNLLDHNLVVKQLPNGKSRIYLIDGFGDSAWISLGRWIPSITRKRIQNRIDRVWAKFEQLYQDGGVSDDLRANSNWDQGFLRHRGRDSKAA